MDISTLIRTLSGCRTLVGYATTQQGIFTPLTPTNDTLLDGFAAVREALADDDYMTERVRRAAGLAPSDWGMLEGLLMQRTIRHDPIGAQVEMLAAFKTWLKDRPDSEALPE